MKVRDNLCARMETFYEQVQKTKLTKRTPVAICIDGRAFHTFTREFKKPFDELLIKTMQETMKYLCKNIQGCVFGYTQSDEIILILADYQTPTSSAWFDYDVQNLCSVSASMTTMMFNKLFERNTAESKKAFCEEFIDDEYNPLYKNEELRELWLAHKKSSEKGIMFKAQCFNIPNEEITNFIYWRQSVATRNSVQILGQANFGHKKLQNKSCSDIKNMLMTKRGINWNDLPTCQKRGSCCVRNGIVVANDGLVKACQLRDTKESKKAWLIDNNIPIFKGDGREYIERLINVVGE